MSWAEVKKVNSDLTKPLDTLMEEKSSAIIAALADTSRKLGDLQIIEKISNTASGAGAYMAVPSFTFNSTKGGIFYIIGATMWYNGAGSSPPTHQVTQIPFGINIDTKYGSGAVISLPSGIVVDDTTYIMASDTAAEAAKLMSKLRPFVIDGSSIQSGYSTNNGMVPSGGQYNVNIISNGGRYMAIPFKQSVSITGARMNTQNNVYNFGHTLYVYYGIQEYEEGEQS